MSLDLLLGTSPNLYLNGKSRPGYKRAWVPIVFCFILFVLATLFFAKDLVFREDPILRTMTISETDPGEISPYLEDFNIAIRAYSSKTDQNFMDMSTFHGYFYHQVISSAEGEPYLQKYDTVQLPTIPCPNGKIFSEEKELNDLQNAFCIDLDNVSAEETSVKGAPMTGNFSRIGFAIEKCSDDNVQDGVVCKSDEEIEDILEDLHISLIFIRKNFDPQDYENPVKEELSFQTVRLVDNMAVTATLQLQNYYIETDFGVIGEDVSIQKYQNVVEVKEQLNQASDVLFNLNIQFHNEKVVYRRTYVKLQQILAELDGFITLAILLLLLAFIPVLKVNYFENLISSIYETDLSSLHKTKEEYIQKVKENKKKNLEEEKQKIIKKIEKCENSGLTRQQSWSRKLTRHVSNLRKNLEGSPRQNPTDSFTPLKLDVPSHTYSKKFSLSSHEISLNIPIEAEKDLDQVSQLPYRTEGNSPKGGKLYGLGLKTTDNANILDGNSYYKEDDGFRSFRREDIELPSLETSQNFGNYKTQDAIKFDGTPQRRESETPQQRFQKIVRKVIEEIVRKRLKLENRKRSRVSIKEENNVEIMGNNNSSQKEQETTKYSSGLLNVHEYEIWGKLCGCQRRKTKEKFNALKYGQQKAKHELDIAEILKKLRQFDRLKELLLTREQLAVFEDLKKPNIMLELQSFEESNTIGINFSQKLKMMKGFGSSTKFKLNPIDCLIALEQKKIKSYADRMLISMYKKINLQSADEGLDLYEREFELKKNQEEKRMEDFRDSSTKEPSKATLRKIQSYRRSNTTFSNHDTKRELLN